VDLFAENATFEFPYLPTIGLERRFEGRLAIRSVLALVGAQIPSFSISNIAIHDMKDASELFVPRRREGQGNRSNLRTELRQSVHECSCRTASRTFPMHIENDPAAPSLNAQLSSFDELSVPGVSRAIRNRSCRSAVLIVSTSAFLDSGRSESAALR
jgi:hypothetical protein